MSSLENVDTAMGHEVLKIRARFVGRIDSQVEELDALMEEVEANPESDLAIKQAADLVHRISGVAPSLGFTEIGALAADAEQDLLLLVRAMDEQRLQSAVGKVDKLTAAMDACSTMAVA